METNNTTRGCEIIYCRICVLGRLQTITTYTEEGKKTITCCDTCGEIIR